MLLDGDHLIREALRAGLTLEAVLAVEGHQPLDAELARLGVTRYEGTASVLAAASPVRTPSGLVAVAEWSPLTSRRLFATSAPLVVGLVDVQDPGNVGAVIRSAHALGATGVLALGSTADPAGWKALRGSMGSAFHLPVGRGSLAEALDSARDCGIPAVGTVAHGGDEIQRADLRPPLLLLAGNEGTGLPADVLAQTDRQVRFPLCAGVESLNVAVTVALAVWEIRRRPVVPGRGDRS